MKRVHIVGRKNSGKTTLIVELVEHLTRAGLRIGTVKHTHHHHELDTPGKDSFRHRAAGAVAVGILSPGMTAIFRPIAETDQRNDRYDHFDAVFADCHLVLVEGDSQAEAVKIEVWRSAVSAQPMAKTEPSIYAVVTDDPLDAGLTTWRRSEVAEIAEKLRSLCD